MLIVRSVFFNSVLPAALLVAAAYQGLMGVNGPDGMMRAEQLAQARAAEAAELARLTALRDQLEEKADRLVMASLDEDLLEERVRAELGHMQPGEYRIALHDLDEVAATEVSSDAQMKTLIAVALLENTGV